MGYFDDIQTAEPQKTAQPQSAVRLDAIEPPNWLEQQLARIDLPWGVEYGLNRARGVAMGMADPVVGGVQLAANVVGSGEGINKAIAEKERAYQAERQSVGSEGVDFARTAGNIASPVNLAAARIPFAATTGRRIVQGATMGAAGGAMEPVTDDQREFWGQKGAQTATGAAFGGVAAPVMGKLGDALARRIQTVGGAVRSAQQVDDVVDKALADVGQTINDLPPGALNSLRQQVADAMRQGKKLDAGAMLRKADFDEAGIPALQGQLTRDPMQFAREQNLRGVAGVGEPIAERLSTQNSQIRAALNDARTGARDSFNAGTDLSGSLDNVDKLLRSHIDDLYGKARDHLGRAAPMDAHAFSQSANDALDGQMLGSVLPPQARSILNDISSGKIPFNVNTAVQIDSTLSALQRSGSKAESLAIGKVRDALNSAPIADNVGMDAKAAFDTARKAAKERFSMHDAIPALKAAADGSVAPDDFVRRFVVNGKTNDVKGLADVLKKADPDAYKQARAQLGDHLYRAAFGDDVIGGKSVATERFNKALRDVGTEKLAAFFSPQEVAQLKRMGRISAYIHQAPAGSAVNSSNTASTMLNLAARVPGVSPLVGAVKSAASSIDNAATVRRAVNADIPATAADLSPDQANALAALLSGGSFALGGLGGAAFR